MKKFILLFLIFCFLISAFSFVFAQRELEIEYPEIFGVRPETVKTGLPEYVKYIFNFAIWIIGLVAFGALIYGGIRYLTSVGNPAVQSDAKDQILAAFLGMIILFSSYFILTTINPQLVIFHTELLTAVAVKIGPGVWLCKTQISDLEEFMINPEHFSKEKQKEMLEKIEKNCYKVLTKESLPKDIGENLQYAYLVGGYGVVLHRDSTLQGDCQVVTESRSVTPALSATPFFINENPSGEGVTLYEGRDFNAEEGTHSFGPTQVSADVITEDLEPCYSIQINEEKQWVAVVFKDQHCQGRCEVFNESDRNLEDDYMSTWCAVGPLLWWRKPCVYSLEVIGGTVLEE